MARGVWQIAAGDGSRDYSSLFLDFGIACIGPGDYGPFPDPDGYYVKKGSWEAKRGIRSFAERVKEGDLLVLKRGAPKGQFEVVAVGEVASPYRFEQVLDDVEGWNLCHAHDVAWRRAPEKTVIGGLRRAALSRVANAGVIQRLSALYDAWPETPSPRRLPPAAEELKDEDLIAVLIGGGLPVSQAEQITQTITRLRRLARWYRGSGHSVGEHEIRTFLIVPLLLALGWPEQRMKIEHQHVDIALFDRPYDNQAQLSMLVESKRLDDGLGEGPAWQAGRYAARYSACRHVLITDGFRYKLSARDGSSWRPVAYANLLLLRVRHPYLEDVPGAGELFSALLP